MEEQRGRGSGNKDDKGERIYSSLLSLSMLVEIIHATTNYFLDKRLLAILDAASDLGAL